MLPILAQIPSKLNDIFSQQDLSFSDYIANIYSMLQKARLDLHQPHIDKEIILKANLPFEYRPANFDGKRGVLLAHGLGDSPSWMNDIAHFFLKRNFLARSILLPGHGTRPGDLLQVNYHAWVAATRYGIETLQKEVEEVYYVGFSTGGALGLYHTLQAVPLKALILISHAHQFTRFNDFANYLFGFTRWLSREDKWVMAQNDCYDYAKYAAFPMNAAWQVKNLINANYKLLKHTSVKIPLCMILSADDETVDPQASIQFFRTQAAEASRLIYYTNKPIELDEERLIQLPSYFPEENILNFSHIALPISPENPHYGRNNDYEKSVIKSPFTKDEIIYQGALSYYNLRHYHIKRLTYNPAFYSMMKHVEEFLDRVG